MARHLCVRCSRRRRPRHRHHRPHCRRRPRRHPRRRRPHRQPHLHLRRFPGRRPHRPHRPHRRPRTLPPAVCVRTSNRFTSSRRRTAAAAAATIGTTTLPFASNTTSGACPPTTRRAVCTSRVATARHCSLHSHRHRLHRRLHSIPIAIRQSAVTLTMIAALWVTRRLHARMGCSLTREAQAHSRTMAKHCTAHGPTRAAHRMRAAIYLCGLDSRQFGQYLR